MSKINRIKTDKILSKYTDTTCCENGICVSIDETIPSDAYVIIKVDKFYNSLNIAKRPASVDCLITAIPHQIYNHTSIAIQGI